MQKGTFDVNATSLCPQAADIRTTRRQGSDQSMWNLYIHLMQQPKFVLHMNRASWFGVFGGHFLFYFAILAFPLVTSGLCPFPSLFHNYLFHLCLFNLCVSVSLSIRHGPFVSIPSVWTCCFNLWILDLFPQTWCSSFAVKLSKKL